MKTRRLGYSLFLIGAILITNLVNAQRLKPHENPKFGADSVSRMECAMNLSTMSEFVNIKTYDYAYEPWRACFFNCPEASKNIYIKGEKIIEHKIENAEDDQKRNAYIDTLMLLYDQRIQYFNEEGKVLGKKGLDLLKYRKEDLETAYGYLGKSVNLSKEKTTEAVAVTFMTAGNVLYKQGEIQADEMIGNYMKTMEALELRLETTRNKKKTEEAIANVEKIFAESGSANCDELVAIFTPKFEANKEDVELLKKITTLLGDNKCYEMPLYAQAAETLYPLEPSAEAAANLGNVFSVKGDFEKAAEYYLMAIEQETDTEKKAEYNFYLSTLAFKEKNFPDVRKYALAAIELKNDYGEAYIMIGNAYLSSLNSCGSEKLKKRDVYWVAVDKFKEAKQVDPTVSEKANNSIAKYSQQFPNNEDTFFAGYKDGDSYTVGCWINEQTKVRTTKM